MCDEYRPVMVVEFLQWSYHLDDVGDGRGFVVACIRCQLCWCDDGSHSPEVPVKMEGLLVWPVPAVVHHMLNG